MKEELQGKLVEILTSIQAAAGKAGEFAMEQLPDIAQSYVAYGRISSLFFVLVGLTLVGVAVVLYLHARQYDKSGGNREDTFVRFMHVDYLASGVVGFFGVCQVTIALDAAFLVWFAPKVWLLKEIATLLK